MKPGDVTLKSSRNVWWKCTKCGYEWHALISSRANGNGCPACSNRTVWAGHNDLATVNPSLAREWHPTKNDSITPDCVTRGSKRKVWWLCQKCGYEWQASVKDRNQSGKCPACIGKALWKGHNDLATVNPSLAREWHPSLNGEITADSVLPGSNYRAWWLCPVCGHEWQAALYNRSKGSGCPACYKNRRGRR